MYSPQVPGTPDTCPLFWPPDFSDQTPKVSQRVEQLWSIVIGKEAAPRWWSCQLSRLQSAGSSDAIYAGKACAQLRQRQLAQERSSVCVWFTISPSAEAGRGSLIWLICSVGYNLREVLGCCKPCRFYRLKEEGCRLGETCKLLGRIRSIQRGRFGHKGVSVWEGS